MSEDEVAELLGLGEATRKKWLRGGHFPGAIQSADGVWTFDRETVLEVQKEIAERKERNRTGNFTPFNTRVSVDPPLLIPDVDAGEPPLL